MVLASLFLAEAPAVRATYAPEFAWIRQFGTSTFDYAEAIGAGTSGVFVAGITYAALAGQTSAGFADAFVRKYDAAGTENWTRQFGTSGFDFAYAVAVDASSVYVAGQTDGTLPSQTNSGSYDAFIRKYDAAGTENWTRQFGTLASDAASALAVDASGVYVAGTTSGVFPAQGNMSSDDAFIRKFDSAGNEIWTRQFGTSAQDFVLGVAVDASGIYVAGTTYGALPGQTNSGSYDVFVRKYDAAGTENWTRQFGSSGFDGAYAIAVDASGVYVAGYTDGALPGQTNSGSYDVFVRKYDAAGTENWTRQFGTSGYDVGRGVAVDGYGVYVAGQTDGEFPGQANSGFSDAFIRKYDSSGVEVWTRQFGTSGGDVGNAIAVDISGFYVAGETDGTFAGQTNAGSTDVFAVKLWRLGAIDGSPELADFDGIEVGSTSTRSVMIRNAGDADLAVIAFSLASGNQGFWIISAPATPFTLRPGSSAEVLIGFVPPATGLFADALRIASDDPFRGFLDIPLRGVGVDTTPPALGLSSPTETLTRDPAITVAGTTEPGSAVTINGATAAVSPTGTFSISLALNEGSNTITVVSRDAAGNTDSAVRVVTRDSIAPALDISTPANGATTQVPTITISGTTEPGVRLVVNGIIVEVSSTGSFSFELALREGSNSIAATATDAAGNSATASRTITYMNPVPGLEQDLARTKADLSTASSQSFLLLLALVVLLAANAVQFAMYRRLKRQWAEKPPTIPPPGRQP